MMGRTGTPDYIAWKTTTADSAGPEVPCFASWQSRDERTEIQTIFKFVKICTDFCIVWARQAGRKGRGEFRRCWQIKISHGKMTRASAEGIGLPQIWGGWCRSSLDWGVESAAMPDMAGGSGDAGEASVEVAATAWRRLRASSVRTDHRSSDCMTDH